jgi:hypothetical protein
VHVGSTHEDAGRVAEPIIDAGYRGFSPDALVYGDPEEVAARFSEFADMGYTDVIVRHLAEDQPAVLRSFEQLAAVRTVLRAR